ncbi:MAG TPA: alpha-L-fucosidase [Fimbriimonadaceae bacterium]|nr:alpha-L-fucosidase [Fimbriimonadaceae bacterium]
MPTLLMASLLAVFASTGHATVAHKPVKKLTAQAQSLDPNAGETKAHRDARMKWWREARFGMFIHWGLYAQLAGEWNGEKTNGAGEWIEHDLKIPIAQYKALTSQFDPVQFNADQWVSIAKAAGMKYIVMTAKHHEGFAMFHPHTDPFNIYDATPFKRDPIAEMGAACKRAGLKFGVYYSQAQDWNHPGGAAYGGHWDPAQDGDLDEYVKKVAAPQVAELLTKYKPAILWWDTPVQMSPEDIRLLTEHMKDDPGLIANNRLGNGVPGDTQTPEQFIPATGYPGEDWETCMTMNDTWGYKSFDTDFKSTETLLRNLIDIASKGGNYLLNVGPEPTGIIPPAEVERLKQMGEWLKRNGASIYATTASPYSRLPFDGRCTVKGHTLYLNVFSWPSEGLKLGGLQTAVKSATVVATGEKLTVEKADDGTLSISQPSLLDPVSTAIALDLAGAPVVVEPEYLVPVSADGSFQLLARDAKLNGSLQIEHEPRSNIGYWTNQGDTAEWKIKVATAGTFEAAIDYSCEPGSEGSTFEVDVDGSLSGITGAVPKTASWQDYQTLNLDGTLTLSAGTHVVRIVAKSKPGLAVMNLRRLSLKPQ